MKNSPAQGREYGPLHFDVVPIPVLPAHERERATPGEELPNYVPRFGAKAALARAWAPTQPGGME